MTRLTHQAEKLLTPTKTERRLAKPGNRLSLLIRYKLFSNLHATNQYPNIFSMDL